MERPPRDVQVPRVVGREDPEGREHLVRLRRVERDRPGDGRHFGRAARAPLVPSAPAAAPAQPTARQSVRTKRDFMSVSPSAKDCIASGGRKERLVPSLHCCSNIRTSAILHAPGPTEQSQPAGEEGGNYGFERARGNVCYPQCGDVPGICRVGDMRRCLAARLLGPLRMTGKQTGWVYATLPIACIVSPLVAGPLADKWLNTEWILAGCHLVGAAFMIAALYQRSFRGMFLAMLLYSLCYGATLPLVNAVLFAHVHAIRRPRLGVHLGPGGWALVGDSLSGSARCGRAKGRGRLLRRWPRVLSRGYGDLVSLPAGDAPNPDLASPMGAAFAMLRQPDFLVFILASRGDRRLDAVLFPRLGAVHDRHGHLVQGGAGRDGRSPRPPRPSPRSCSWGSYGRAWDSRRPWYWPWGSR